MVGGVGCDNDDNDDDYELWRGNVPWRDRRTPPPVGDPSTTTAVCSVACASEGVGEAAGWQPMEHVAVTTTTTT